MKNNLYIAALGVGAVAAWWIAPDSHGWWRVLYAIGGGVLTQMIAGSCVGIVLGGQDSKRYKTHAIIGVPYTDGYQSIYLHMSGHPEHAGVILANYYADWSTANALIALGDLLILGPRIGGPIPFDSMRALELGQCLAFGRDRGDADAAPLHHPNQRALKARAKAAQAEWLYIFEGSSWRPLRRQTTRRTVP